MTYLAEDSLTLTLHGGGLAALVLVVVAMSIAFAVILINYR